MTRRTEEVLEVPGGWCLTVTDLPAGTPRALVVCAHGLTGDRSGPAGLLAEWAARLAAHGLAVVRFDFRGSGESSGAFEQTSFRGMVEDMVAVGSWALGQIGPVPLVTAGISIGGVPAALSARPLGAAAAVLMSSDLIEDVRFDTAGMTAIRGGEAHLPARFFREREELRPRQELLAAGVPWLLLYGEDDVKVSRAAADLAALGAEVVAVPAADHLFGSGRARTRLAASTAEFVDRTLNRG
ncbi:MAG TPA: alpha/beta fold hydrolase [Mycobacteriales bacterium]|jgi:pimeloyl-ACP methyl ester carboxylesterase|nr:alpha/beta fold hydrolase [Mycobacteriales bacterium]